MSAPGIPTPPARSRLLWAATALGIIGCGILIRSRFVDLPHAATKYGGDALWALMVFVLVGFLFPRKPTRVIATIAVLFAASIEFLQLYHAPWIDDVRSLWIGRMVLGSTFNPPDLLAYAVGILLGATAELAWRSRRP